MYTMLNKKGEIEMYFIYGLILLICSIFQFESNFKRGCILVILSLGFFALDLFSEFLRAFRNDNSKNKITMEINSQNKNIK